jgi:general secretion pathway protein E
MAHEDATAIQQLAIDEGMMTLYENGLEKVIQGITTLEEVLRVTSVA